MPSYTGYGKKNLQDIQVKKEKEPGFPPLRHTLQYMYITKLNIIYIHNMHNTNHVFIVLIIHMNKSGYRQSNLGLINTII